MGGSLRDFGACPSHFRFFVETGTYRGKTTRLAASLFERVFTIELSEEIHAATKARLAHLSNVRFLQGDSSARIADLAWAITEPAVFFLDAHYSGGVTAKGAKEVPLYDELEQIARRALPDLVIMDDARLFGRSGASQGNAEYPGAMQFDWTDITVARCLEILQSHGAALEYKIADDRVFVMLQPPSVEPAAFLDHLIETNKRAVFLEAA